MKMKIHNILLFTVILLLSGCGDSSTPTDTPTSGEITISVDESIARIIESEISTFEQIYEGAKINVHYKPEDELFKDLIEDSSRLIIAARRLNTDEIDYFRKVEIVPTTTKICYDAVAIIVNNSNKDSLLSFNTIKEILSGRILTWKEAVKGGRGEKIQIVYDNSSSSTLRYIRELTQNKLSPSSFAVRTNPEVINYVSKNHNALGIIGVNWVSDRDDSITNSFLNTIRVVGIKSDLPNVNPNEYYQPYQAYIAMKFYPMIREYYIVSREAYTGLGSGFSAFVAGEKGQRIFLKSGLVPATMPVRLVETYQ